jgi:hypothetical protein
VIWSVAATVLFFGSVSPSDAEIAATPFTLRWFRTDELDKLPPYLRTAVQAECGLSRWEVTLSRTLVPRRIIVTVHCQHGGFGHFGHWYDISEGKAEIYRFIIH